MTEEADRSVRSYRPGDWFGIVGERVVVALPPSEKARVAALWELVDDGAGFDVTLDRLISGGLRDLPAFALISRVDGTTTLVLRGPARVEVEVDGKTVVVEGLASTTWVERSLSGATGMRLVLGDQPDDSAQVRAGYVVDSGLFRVSQLEERPAAAAAAAAPAPSRSPEPPAWRPPPPTRPPAFPPVTPAPPALPPPPPWVPLDEAQTDHDGLTLAGGWQPPDAVPPGIPGQEPAPEVTIPVARLLISSGEVVDVDRVVVIGRAPESRRYDGAERPRLVTVPSPQLEVSATHVEVRPGVGVDHGTAVVTDLGSTNGTVVVQPGIGPEDLAPGVTVSLVPGALIDLGDGVTIQVTAPSGA